LIAAGIALLAGGGAAAGLQAFMNKMSGRPTGEGVAGAAAGTMVSGALMMSTGGASVGTQIAAGAMAGVIGGGVGRMVESGGDSQMSGENMSMDAAWGMVGGAMMSMASGSLGTGPQPLTASGSGVVKEALTTSEAPAINAQKQAGHVSGTSQNVNRLKQGKPTSSFFGGESGERLTQIAHERGAPVPGRPGVKEHDFGFSTGTGPNGGMQTRVRVHQSPKTGEIHGHPSGPER